MDIFSLSSCDSLMICCCWWWSRRWWWRRPWRKWYCCQMLAWSRRCTPLCSCVLVEVSLRMQAVRCLQRSQNIRLMLHVTGGAFHAVQTLDLTTTTKCTNRTKGVSFYSVPHYQENAYHLHNDNFMPTSTNILSTPCLCDGVELSSCNRFEKVCLGRAGESLA